MDWTRFWLLLCLAAALLGAAYGCYLGSGSPGVLEWAGWRRTLGLVLCSAGVFVISRAQVLYDYNMPAAVFSGTVESFGCYKSCVLRVRNTEGHSVDFNPDGGTMYVSTHDAVCVHYTPSSREVLFIEDFAPDGSTRTVRFQKSYANVWTGAAIVLLLLAFGPRRRPEPKLNLPLPINEPGNAP